MDAIRVGLMGLGHWARGAYAPVLRELQYVHIVAVSARSEETFAFAREQFGADIALYSDPGDLAADEDVDAVMIALPNRLHGSAARAAVASGKHVFVEPPVGFDADEISAVLRSVEDYDAVFQTDLELRYTPVMRLVADRVHSGLFGEPLMARVRLWTDWGYGGGEWLEEAEAQGFFLWLGCWYLDVLDVVFAASPLRASVIGGRAMNRELLDHGWAALEYPAGGLGELEFSLIAPEKQQITLRVTGPNAELEADLWTGDCRWRHRGEDWHEEHAPCSQPVHGFVGMRESIQDFFACIRSGSAPRADLAATRRVHEAAVACMRSEQEDETVRVKRL